MGWINFKKFLTESTKQQVLIVEDSKAALNDPLARFHEHALAYNIMAQHYQGKKPPASAVASMNEHRKAMEVHAADLHKRLNDPKQENKLLSEQMGRSLASAKSTLEMAKQKGYNSDIIHIDHTGTSGIQKYGDSADSNASDIVMHFKDKNKKAHSAEENKDKLGVSAKSSKDGNIGFYNGGMSSHTAAMGAPEIGKKAEEFKRSKQEEIFGKGVSQTDVKKQVRDIRKKKEANKKAVKEGKPEPMPLSKDEKSIDDKVQQAAKDVHKYASDEIAKHYNNMANTDHEGLRKHLENLVLRSDSDNKLDHIKSTGFGSDDKMKEGDKPETFYKGHAVHPDDNPMNQAVKNAHHFSFHRTGDSYMHVVAHVKNDKGQEEKKHLFSFQVKHNDDKLGSSLKVIGQPSTKKFDELPTYNEKKLAAASKEED